MIEKHTQTIRPPVLLRLGLALEAAGAVHDVHQVDGSPGKRHAVLPQLLTEVGCVLTGFFFHLKVVVEF